MATTLHKWRQLPTSWRSNKVFGNGIDLDLAYAVQVGYVFDDNTDNWYIIVDGVRYNCNDTSITDAQWAVPYSNLGDKDPNNDEIAVFNATGKGINRIGNNSYVVKIDENGDEYYINTSGQRIYAYNKGSDPSADAFVNRKLTNRSDLLYDTTDVVIDILGNPIIPNIPKLGLYDTVAYLEEVLAKKKQYKEFYKTKDNKILANRAIDIISQQDALIKILNKSGLAVKKEKVFMGVVTLAVIGFGIVSGTSVTPKNGAISKVGSKFAGAVTGVVTSGLAARPIAEREQLRQNDLLLLQSELEAIEAFINKPTSNDVGTKKTLTTPQIIAIGLVFTLITYLIWRRYR